MGDPTAMRCALTFAAILLLLAYIPLPPAWANEPICVLHVEGEPTGNIFGFHAAAGEVLVGAENGLFRYDGTRTVHVRGEPTGEVLDFYDIPGSPLLNTGNGLLRYDGN